MILKHQRRSGEIPFGPHLLLASMFVKLPSRPDSNRVVEKDMDWDTVGFDSTALIPHPAQVYGIQMSCYAMEIIIHWQIFPIIYNNNDLSLHYSNWKSFPGLNCFYVRSKYQCFRDCTENNIKTLNYTLFTNVALCAYLGLEIANKHKFHAKISYWLGWFMQTSSWFRSSYFISMLLQSSPCSDVVPTS